VQSTNTGRRASGAPNFCTALTRIRTFFHSYCIHCGRGVERERFAADDKCVRGKAASEDGLVFGRCSSGLFVDGLKVRALEQFLRSGIVFHRVQQAESLAIMILRLATVARTLVHCG
jgi:hypothetical protein